MSLDRDEREAEEQHAREQEEVAQEEHARQLDEEKKKAEEIQAAGVAAEEEAKRSGKKARVTDNAPPVPPAASAEKEPTTDRSADVKKPSVPAPLLTPSTIPSAPPVPPSLKSLISAAVATDVSDGAAMTSKRIEVAESLVDRARRHTNDPRELTGALQVVLETWRNVEEIEAYRAKATQDRAIRQSKHEVWVAEESAELELRKQKLEQAEAERLRQHDLDVRAQEHQKELAKLQIVREITLVVAADALAGYVFHQGNHVAGLFIAGAALYPIAKPFVMKFFGRIAGFLR